MARPFRPCHVIYMEMKLKFRKRSWHQGKLIWFRNDCLLLVSFISVKACASHKTPQRTHADTHAHRALFYCLAQCGYIRITQEDDSSHLSVCCGIDWSQETELILLLLLLFCCLFWINLIGFFRCLLLFLLLHFHPLNFYFLLPPAHYNAPALHCVISPLLQCILEYHRIWSLILMMR